MGQYFYLACLHCKEMLYLGKLSEFGLDADKMKEMFAFFERHIFEKHVRECKLRIVGDEWFQDGEVIQKANEDGSLWKTDYKYFELPNKLKFKSWTKIVFVISTKCDVCNKTISGGEEGYHCNDEARCVTCHKAITDHVKAVLDAVINDEGEVAEDGTVIRPSKIDMLAEEMFNGLQIFQENEELVDLITKFQKTKGFHPLTCKNDSEHKLMVPYPDLENKKLMLKCPDCDYTQPLHEDLIKLIKEIVGDENGKEEGTQALEAQETEEEGKEEKQD